MVAKFDPTELVESPMRNVSISLPQLLLNAIDKAAGRDDPSSPNRSSWIRGALIGRLKREAA
jgi:metal-responsive CopG/Arc/MetJ family transcriptional regulator